MLQWREQAVPPLGQAKWDLEMMSEIFTRVQDLYRKEGGKCPEAVTKVNWDYKVDGKWSIGTRCPRYEWLQHRDRQVPEDLR